MRTHYLFLFLCLALGATNAQDKYFTKDGHISFFSHSIVEDITATNDQVLSVLDTKTGKIAIQLLMRSFMFEKALMREHFNENYVESDVYPKAKFSGTILHFKTLDELPTEIEIGGKLSIHGVEQEVSTMANIQTEPDEIVLSGNFEVKVADYNIKIPALVRNNISKTIRISFELYHKPYK